MWKALDKMISESYGSINHFIWAYVNTNIYKNDNQYMDIYLP